MKTHGVSVPVLAFTAMLGLALQNCGGASDEDVPGDDTSASDEALSSSIPKDGKFGLTTFGGPGDRERSMACTHKSSASSQKWYVASSQRYGCLTHLKLTAKGKCLVVRTEDAGPATWVEKAARTEVLDSSPAVTNFFFGDTLGQSDLRAHPGKYEVRVERTNLPLGPCDD